MIKRTIEISRNPVYLSVEDRQLMIRPRSRDTDDSPTRIPCEDVGMLLIDEPGTTMSQGAMTGLLQAGAVVVFCGPDHLPKGMLLPLAAHTQVVQRLHAQIAASRPLVKRLWAQLVAAKIKAQAANLESVAGRRKVLGYARQVRSGDPDNREAHAAKAYWRYWLAGDGSVRFRRDPENDPPNNFLNYGYAVFRAAVARALVAAGLHPTLGLHHANRSNPFCLADDIMEPLRPIVDARVRALYREGATSLDQATKAELLKLLTITVRMGEDTGPLMVALTRMVASLVKCLVRERKELVIPVHEAGKAPWT